MYACAVFLLQYEHRCGRGTTVYRCGDKYTGEVCVCACVFIRRHGVYTYALRLTRCSFKVYDLQYKDDLPHGVGEWLFANGELYKGSWDMGTRHCVGVFLYQSGAVYRGKWNHDVREGYAVMSFADGSTYTGNWVNDKRNGQGKQTFPPPSCEEYEGEVRVLHSIC